MKTLITFWKHFKNDNSLNIEKNEKNITVLNALSLLVALTIELLNYIKDFWRLFLPEELLNNFIFINALVFIFGSIICYFTIVKTTKINSLGFNNINSTKTQYTFAENSRKIAKAVLVTIIIGIPAKFIIFLCNQPFAISQKDDIGYYIEGKIECLNGRSFPGSNRVFILNEYKKNITDNSWDWKILNSGEYRVYAFEPIYSNHFISFEFNGSAKILPLHTPQGINNNAYFIHTLENCN